ncbi:MAG: formylglycine-generating enzyme family protein [Candidatus Thiodiazotropha taylori]|nr:formylglycine-generating enzyme family protein [Candidatus Thiodiazotropha taylori]
MGDRRSQHKVNVRSFELGKYELTQSQWTAVMGSNPSAFSSCEECPVERVSWNDAQEYIHKLNQLTGKRYRLPSEAEWEFACRGGGKERSHCGTARNIDRFAWYKNTSNGKTHPVGKKSPNELLLYDMSGNVWEWVQDCWNESHVGSPRTGSAWLIGDCNRAVLRGGSWVVSERKLRAYHRYNKKRDFQYSTFGFRLAKDL